MIKQLNLAPIQVNAKGQSLSTITLTDCAEYVGVGLVSTAQAQMLLPPEFTLLNEGKPVTPLVVLAMHCKGIAVAEEPPRAGSIVQIGLLIASPDGSGDVNTFTLWHYTTHLALARQLNRAGMRAQLVAETSFDATLGSKVGAVRVVLPSPARPSLSLTGTITEPGAALPPFTGNWWARVDHGLLKMSTSVPNSIASESHLALTTDEYSPLGQLIGAGTLSFAVLQRFNTFAQARTNVSMLTPHDF